MKATSPRRVLARTALQLGGIHRLAAELKVSEPLLRKYIDGSESIPEGLMLQIIDVLLKQFPVSRTQ